MRASRAMVRGEAGPIDFSFERNLSLFRLLSVRRFFSFS